MVKAMVRIAASFLIFLMLSLPPEAPAFSPFSLEDRCESGGFENGGKADCCCSRCERDDCCVGGSESEEPPASAPLPGRIPVGFDLAVYRPARVVFWENGAAFSCASFSESLLVGVRTRIYQFFCSYLI